MFKVDELTDEIKQLIESSEDGDFITLTLSTTGEPVFVLMDRIRKVVKDEKNGKSLLFVHQTSARL